MVSTLIYQPIQKQITSFNKVRQVTAWILRFVHNCRANKNKQAVNESTLKTNKLILAKERWIASAKQTAYLKKK